MKAELEILTFEKIWCYWNLLEYIKWYHTKIPKYNIFLKRYHSLLLLVTWSYEVWINITVDELNIL